MEGRHKCSEDYFALLFSSEARKKEGCPPLAGVQGVVRIFDFPTLELLKSPSSEHL